MPLTVPIPTDAVSEIKGGGYTCGVDGCDRRVAAKGFCGMHYTRWRAHGDPTAGRAPNGSALRLLEHGLATLRPEDPCPTWPYSRTPAGYPTIRIGGTQKMVAHVILERTDNGSRPEGKEACHSCNNGHLGCWHPSHLRWDTHDANLKEAAAKPGGLNRGENHGMAKLTTEQVLAIRAASGSHAAVGRAFGISRERARDIRNRKEWRHI